MITAAVIFALTYLVIGLQRVPRLHLGRPAGALLGAILISILEQSLRRWIGISDFMRDFLTGVLILVAVASDKVVMGRVQEAWIRVKRRDDAAARVARGEPRGAGG